MIGNEINQGCLYSTTEREVASETFIYLAQTSIGIWNASLKSVHYIWYGRLLWMSSGCDEYYDMPLSVSWVWKRISTFDLKSHMIYDIIWIIQYDMCAVDLFFCLFFVFLYFFIFFLKELFCKPKSWIDNENVNPGFRISFFVKLILFILCRTPKKISISGLWFTK